MKTNAHLLMYIFLIVVTSFITTQALHSQSRINRNNWSQNANSLMPGQYIAPRSGTYLEEIMLESRGSIAPFGPLVVMFRDTSITYNIGDYILKTDSYELRRAVDGVHDWFIDTIYTSWNNYYDPNIPGDIYSCFRIPNVMKGDTLTFSYFNWNETPHMHNSADITLSQNDPDWYITGYMDGFQELKCISLKLRPMKFNIWKEAETANFGTSVALRIYPTSDFRNFYPNIDDSLLTIEVDSAQYARFIYQRDTGTDTLESPIDSIKVSDAASGKIRFIAKGIKPEKPTPVAICARLMSDPTKVFEDTIVVRGNEILLGESKYYYATDVNGKLTIHEAKSPQLPSGAVNTDIWGDTPVSANTSEQNYARKIGVYWEKEKPKPDGGGNLPKGMIRLIGRYWRADSVYVVQLTTTTGDGKLRIEVRKPAKLGSAPNNKNDGVKDVFGNTIAIDDTIIKYAGENGIPPQFIKGQMKQESNFKPAWRYEPIRDLDYQTTHFSRFFLATYPFVITLLNPTGFGDRPSLHKNVYTYVTSFVQQQYPTAGGNNPPITIGGYIASNLGAYKKKGKLGQPDSILYCTDLSQRYRELYKPPTKLNDKEDKKAKIIAEDALCKELREGTTDVANTYNIIAQTRIVTSYGFTQLMYTMTVDDGKYTDETERRYAPTETQYMNKTDQHQYPEKLNEQNTFMPIYCDRLLRDLHVLLNGKIPSSQWHGTYTIINKKTGIKTIYTYDGFEQNWRGSLIYYNYPQAYRDSVMRKSKDYLPQ